MTEARKNKDSSRVTILSVLITDADKVGKDDGNRKPTDEEVVRVAKKLINANEELINQIDKERMRSFRKSIHSWEERSDKTFDELCKEHKYSNEEIDRLGFQIDTYDKENDILNEYLPQQISEKDLRFIVFEFAALIDPSIRNKSIGTVMKYLKEEFPGRYDGKMASSIVKEELSKEL